MAATITQVRDGLKEVLEGITGLHAYDEWPDKPNPPAALPQPASGQYNLTMDEESAAHNFEIVVIVTMGGGIAKAQALLDPYLSSAGTSSIRKTLRANKTLGGVIDDLNVKGYRNYGRMEIGDVVYFGAVLDVEVWV